MSGVRISLRPIGAPLPLGFFALAVGSFELTGLQLHWIGVAQGHLVATCLLAFVVPLQLISCVFGMLARDTIAATGMGLLVGTWLAIGAVLHASAPGKVSGALGLLLVGSGAALITVAAAAGFAKPLATAVIGTTGVRFVAAGVYELTGAGVWQTTAGVVGVVLSALAWYAASALLLEDAVHRPLLPTFRRDPSGVGGGEDLTSDLAHLATEAGVRHPA
jgi:succinate-acetate transporter protein